jgi:hypothetical protein
MKNGDMPAMPLPMGSETSQGCEGLTKREMMAMNIAAGNMAARSIKWSEVNVQFQAEIAIQMTDALLAELERTKSS